MHTLDDSLRWSANLTPEQKHAVDEIVEAVVKKTGGNRSDLTDYAGQIARGFKAIQFIEQEAIRHEHLVKFVQDRVDETKSSNFLSIAPGYSFYVDILHPATRCSKDTLELFDVLRWILFRLTEAITSPYPTARAPVQA